MRRASEMAKYKPSAQPTISEDGQRIDFPRDFFPPEVLERLDRWRETYGNVLPDGIVKEVGDELVIDLRPLFKQIDN
jgi:hypothetical protein